MSWFLVFSSESFFDFFHKLSPLFFGVVGEGVGVAGSVRKNIRPTDCMGCFLDSVLECRVAEI